MKTIELSKGKKTIVDDEDFQHLNKFKWYVNQNRKDGDYYAIRDDYNDGRKIRIAIHRLIMNAPKGMLVDHINGDTLDNRKSNLRIVTPRQNHQNFHRKDYSSKYPGVHFHKYSQRWRSTIEVDGDKIHLGYFDTEKEAYKNGYLKYLKDHNMEYI
jgi:hypothetical protein